MSTVSRSALVRHFRTLFEVGTVAGLTDGQLLERFFDCRGEAGEVAFEAIVARHGPMVLGVCRRALADPNDASDAFQATFLILVRKGRSIRVDDSLGRWLYGVSRKVAARVRKTVARRPRMLAQDVEAVATDPDRFELSSILDEELGKLPEAFRSALVLCDLEGFTHEEAARDLVCPVGTIKSRLARGRQRLRERLERRGFVPSLLMLAPPAVPKLLASSAVKASVLWLVSGRSIGGVVPASAVVLAEGVLKAMSVLKLKLAALVVLSLGIVGSGAGVLALGKTGDGEPTTIVTKSVPSAPAEGKADDRPGRHDLEMFVDQMTFDRTGVTEDELASMIRSSIEGQPNPWILIRVQKEIPLNALKRVTDLIQKAGISELRFGPAFSDLERKLRSPVTINLKDQPLDEVLAELGKSFRVNFVLDPKAMNDLNITPQSRVNLTANAIKLKNALKYMLSPLGLAYQVEDDSLLITARKNLDARSFLDLSLCGTTGEMSPQQRSELNSALQRLTEKTREKPEANAGPVFGLSNNIPVQLKHVSEPEYIVEPPDIIRVEVLEALPGRPITGDRLVRPDGRISLGFYGDVYVAGLTLNEIKEKVALHLKKFLDDEKLGLSSKNPETGKLEPVKPEETNRIFVDVTSFNSKVYYVQGDVGVPGSLPIKGHETVLDAINFAGGLIPSSNKSSVRLVRPSTPGASDEQILPVDLDAIISRGDTKTNYRLQAGDRLVVDSNRKFALEPVPADLEARLRTVEQKLDEVLKILEKLPKP